MFFRNIVFAALVAGFFGGLFLGALQTTQVTPIILGAEVYEVTNEPTSLPTTLHHDHSNPAQHTPEHRPEHMAALAADAHPYDSKTSGHHHDADAWAPEDGLERTFFTFLSATLVTIGFALMLSAGMTFTNRTSILSGLAWGLAGYIVFFVAPGLGLPPEIPGSQSAALEGRQSWWLLTVILTAVGLGVTAFGKGYLRLMGMLAMAIPFIIGAPQPELHGFANTDPQATAALTALETQFIQTTAWVNGLSWMALGVCCSLCLRYLFKTHESTLSEQ